MYVIVPIRLLIDSHKSGWELDKSEKYNMVAVTVMFKIDLHSVKHMN